MSYYVLIDGATSPAVAQRRRVADKYIVSVAFND
jgi:hypothetical protein